MKPLHYPHLRVPRQLRRHALRPRPPARWEDWFEHWVVCLHTAMARVELALEDAS